MRDTDFELWMERVYEMGPGERLARKTRQDTMSNCRRVERHLGDLDAHFAKDQMAGLLRRFEYGRDEEARKVPPSHGIPIKGSQYSVTASLKSGLHLYLKFCKAWPKGASAPRGATHL